MVEFLKLLEGIDTIWCVIKGRAFGREQKVLVGQFRHLHNMFPYAAGALNSRSQFKSLKITHPELEGGTGIVSLLKENL